MPLDKPTLVFDFETIFSNASTTNNYKQVARELADAVEKYVKSGLVTGVCPAEGGALLQGKVT